MLRKLQQRSTFSCTDRTRKEKGVGGGDKSEEGMRGNKGGSQAPR